MLQAAGEPKFGTCGQGKERETLKHVLKSQGGPSWVTITTGNGFGLKTDGFSLLTKTFEVKERCLLQSKVGDSTRVHAVEAR